MYDLHLHSVCSDGDLSPAEVVEQAAARGVQGVSLTDHNGIWGVVAAQEQAAKHGIACLPGIEITALFNRADVHILGYSTEFKAEILAEGLAATRQGYEERVRQMIERCAKAGFDRVQFEAIAASRLKLASPCYVSYDVAKALRKEYGLSIEETRHLTVRGGVCYVPYGEWALTPAAVVHLLHEAGGVAVLAHPGTVQREAGEEALQELLKNVSSVGIDGIEVFHPFHDAAFTNSLREWTDEHGLLRTGGSDWHGPGRFHDDHFGKVGTTPPDWQQLMAAIKRYV